MNVQQSPITWTERYNIFITHVGGYALCVKWETDGYHVSINNRDLPKVFSDDAAARQYALRITFQWLQAALLKLTTAFHEVEVIEA